MRSGRSIRVWALVLPLSVALSGALTATPASAAGGLRFLGCVTGKLPIGSRPRAARRGGCTPTRTAVLDAEGSGLDHLGSLAASADGRSLYAVSSREDTVSAFRVKPLGLQQCLTATAKLRRVGKQPCTLLPHAGSPDDATGFNGVRFVTTSPDGRSVYTLSGDDHSIGIFARNPHSGKLTYKGCITGGKGSNSTGRQRVCTPIPSATNSFDGDGSGLGAPSSLSVSPDSRFVYVAARGDAAVTTFARAGDGSLSFRGCITGGSAFASGPPAICTLAASEEANPQWSGLRGVSRLVLSPDGTSLYASAPKSASVAEFQRDPASGKLTYAGCISAESRGVGPGDPCTLIPTAQEAAFDSGMWLINALAVSPDGHSLYGVAPGDNAVDSFSRNPATGALKYTGCITGDSGLAEEFGAGNPCTPLPGAQPQALHSGLAEPVALAISPSGAASTWPPARTRRSPA